MTIEKIIQSDPKFEGLSDEAKSIVLERVRSKFDALSPEAQGIVMQQMEASFGPQIGPVATRELPGEEIGPAPVPEDPKIVLSQMAASGDVKGLVENPAWPSLAPEIRNELIRVAGNAARDKHLEELKKGTMVLGEAAATMLPFGGAGKIGLTSLLRGAPTGRATLGVPLSAAKIGVAKQLAGEAAMGAASTGTKVVKAVGKGIKGATVTADEILKFLGGSPLAAAGKKLGLEQTAPNLMKIMQSPGLQRVVGLYTLSKILFGEPRKGGKVTGRVNQPTSEGLRTEIEP